MRPPALLNNAKAPPGNLKKWRNALTRVRTGAGNARVLCLGDSTTFGAYSNGGADTGDLTTNSYPALLAGLFNSAGINAHRNSFMGDGGGFETSYTGDASCLVSRGGNANVGVQAAG